MKSMLELIEAAEAYAANYPESYRKVIYAQHLAHLINDLCADQMERVLQVVRHNVPIIKATRPDTTNELYSALDADGKLIVTKDSVAALRRYVSKLVMDGDLPRQEFTTVRPDGTTETLIVWTDDGERN